MPFVWDSNYTNEVLTRTEFISRVRTRFDEDSANFITNIQINALIEDGIRDISRRTGMYKTSCYITANGSSSYELPVDMTKLDYVEYTSVDNTKKQLSLSNTDEISALGYSSSLNPSFYIRNGNTISLYGNPLSGTIKLYGTKHPTLPQLDSDFIDIPSQYLEILYSWIEWKYWTRRRSPDESKLAQDLYFELIKDILEDIDQEYSIGVTMYGKFQE